MGGRARIVVSDNISLDGVIEDPAGDEGFARGGWVGLISNRPDLGQVTLDDARNTGAMLMGRRTYEWFAARWPSRTGELADRLNRAPKYVVSSTLETADWNNTTVLSGDVAEAVAQLKRDVDGVILVAGSAQLVQALLAADLVDELRLMVFPIVLGSGKRLFGPTGGQKKRLALADAKPLEDGVTIMTYRPAAA